MTTPQIIISLSPNGELVTELPGLNGSRRKINLNQNQQSLKTIASAIQILRDIQTIPTQNAANELTNLLDNDNTTCDILLRILNSQVSNKNQIGEDGNPTEQQVKHWQKHSNIWGDPSCPFCISEGKFEKGYNREKSIKGLTEHEALRLGLISRGFAPSKDNPEFYSKKNMAPIWLKTNGKVLNNKSIEWSKTHRDALILDGKIYAKTHDFKPLEVIKHKGTVVKKQSKMIKETQTEKLQRKIGNLNF